MTNKDANKQNLAYVMATRLSQVETLIDQLRAGVNATVNGYKADSTNWGFAGNLEHTIELLNDTVTFLGQTGVK